MRNQSSKRHCTQSKKLKTHITAFYNTNQLKAMKNKTTIRNKRASRLSLKIRVNKVHKKAKKI